MGLHIVAHGAPGTFYLGNAQLNLDTLDLYTQALRSWFISTPQYSNTPTPQLNFYSCNVAARDAGDEFITKLQTLTGANIAASSHLVGAKSLGGTWNLNTRKSEEGIDSAFTDAVLEEYQAVLSAPFVDLDSTVSGNHYSTVFLQNQNNGAIAIYSVNTIITDLDNTNIESATITPD